MIGAGVFTTSGFSLNDLGDRRYVMLAWAIGGVIAICGAYSYGRLAQRITESGGEYLFLSRLVHPAVGFIAGWVSLLAGFTGAIAFAATTFETYAIPDSIRPAGLPPGIIAVAIIFLFGAMHSVGLKSGLRTQNLIVVFKLILLAGFVGFAFSKFPDHWTGWQTPSQPKPFSILSIAGTLVWISLSFSGFNAAVYVTGEFENPKRDVPRALVLGTLIATIFYLVLNFIFVFGPTPDKITGVPDVAIGASQAIGGGNLATLIRIIVSVALLSSVSSMIVAGPRVYAKMADDGVFPKLLAATEKENGVVPATAIWLQVVLASVVTWFSSLISLLDYLSITLSVSAALTVACIFWAQPSPKNDRGGFSKTLVQVTAFIFIAATLSLATLSAIGKPQKLTAFALTIVSGLTVYFAMGLISSRRQPKRV